MQPTTIAAIATPLGDGGIGIIKVSGPHALAIAGRLFRPARLAGDGGTTLASVPRRLVYGHLFDPATGSLLDEVLVSYMPAPHTYTCEDIVEIHAHAGRVGLSAILNLVLASGAQLAGPGEFTKRAFLNGRIDLTQAEAVIDLIHANSKAALSSAAGQLQGRLGESITTLRRHMVRLQAEVEACIDFPDELEDLPDLSRWAATIGGELLPKIHDLIDRHSHFQHVHAGIRIALVGPPNVGKSSLMNRLVMQERSIVTPIPGTTRDLVEETLLMDGLSFRITDTAGLRETDDVVEKIGVERTLQAVGCADLVLFMLDHESALSGALPWLDRLTGKAVILVRNKIDLADGGGHERPDHSALREWPWVPISVLADQGLDLLKRTILERVQATFRYPEQDAMIPNVRHKIRLERARDELAEAVDALRGQLPVEMVAINLGRAADALGEITGHRLREDMLDEIFSRFCIGK